MNPTTNVSAGAKLNAYIPPKGWEELNDSEKIERMREIVQQQSRAINAASLDTNWLKNLFFGHKHDLQNGEVMTKPEQYRGHDGLGELSASNSTSGKTYF